MIVFARSGAVAWRVVRVAIRTASALFFLGDAAVLVVGGVVVVIFGSVLGALVTISRHPVSAAIFYGLLAALVAAVLMLPAHGATPAAVGTVSLLPTRCFDDAPGTSPAGRGLPAGGAFLPLAAAGFGGGGDHPARLAGASSRPAGDLPAAPRAGRGDDPHLRQPREAAEREAEPVGGLGAPPGLVVVVHP